MAVRKIRLDEDSLRSLLEDGLRQAGFLQEVDHIEGLEFKTRKIKAGGSFSSDPLETGYAGEVELVRWVRAVVKVAEPKEESDDES